MTSRDVKDLLNQKWREKKFVCVDLDTDPGTISDDVVQLAVRNGKVNLHSKILLFNRAIIDATASVAGAYKFGLTYYIAQGTDGIGALKDTVSYLHDRFPSILVIGDGNFSETGDAAQICAEAMFDRYKFDAVTLNPYPSVKGLEPFLQRDDKGCFLLCKTLDTDSDQCQSLMSGGEPLFLVARHAADNWIARGNCGLVIDGQSPDQLELVRNIVDGTPILITDVGVNEDEIATITKAAISIAGSGILISPGPRIAGAKQRHMCLRHEFSDSEAAGRTAEEIHRFILHALRT